MNNLKRKILKRAYAQPKLPIGGLANLISPGGRTVSDVQHLVDGGYLLNNNGLELSTKKGLACIDSSSLRNRMKRVGKGVLLILVLPVLAVVIGNWLWNLIQAILF